MTHWRPAAEESQNVSAKGEMSLLRIIAAATGIVVILSFALLGMSHLLYALYGTTMFYPAFMLYLISLATIIQVLYAYAPLARWLSTTLVLLSVAASLYVLGAFALPLM